MIVCTLNRKNNTRTCKRCTLLRVQLFNDAKNRSGGQQTVEGTVIKRAAVLNCELGVPPTFTPKIPTTGGRFWRHGRPWTRTIRPPRYNGTHRHSHFKVCTRYRSHSSSWCKISVLTTGDSTLSMACWSSLYSTWAVDRLRTPRSTGSLSLL